MNYYFELGVAAAMRDKAADACPFPTGRKRQEWLRGYCSVKTPSVPRHTESLCLKRVEIPAS